MSCQIPSLKDEPICGNHPKIYFTNLIGVVSNLKIGETSFSFDIGSLDTGSFTQHIAVANIKLPIWLKDGEVVEVNFMLKMISKFTR